MPIQSLKNLITNSRLPHLFLIAFLLLAASLGLVKILNPSSISAETQPPAVINYQGKVLENGV
ncbi:MAG: hypothetical protein ABEJ02_04725, partial [Candidatus Paceibacteria bacterium]